MNQGVSFGCGPFLTYPPVPLSHPTKSGTEEGAKRSLEEKLGVKMTEWWGTLSAKEGATGWSPRVIITASPSTQS